MKTRNTTVSLSLATFTLAATFLGLSGCDEKKSSSASSGGASLPPPTSPDNPTTILGKSAKMGKDAKAQIEGEQAQAAAAAGRMSGEGNFLEVTGLMFPVAASWTSVPASGMRAAQYKITTEDGPVEVVVFKGIGGDADANIARWKQQVKSDVQQPPAKTNSITTPGGTVKVTRIALEGTYAGMTAGGTTGAPTPGTRFIGVVVEGPSGPVQMRVTGPINAVKTVEKDFDAMISGVQVK